MAQITPFTNRADRLRRFPLLLVDDLAHPELAPADRSHLLRALRSEVGDQVNVSDGTGGWRPAVLCTTDADLRWGEALQEVRPQPTLTVAFAPTKGVKPESIVKQLTELGIDRIVILRSERSVVTYDDGRTERLLRKLKVTISESCQQSRQPFRPTVDGVVDLARFVAERPEALLCDPSGRPLLQQECPVNTPLSVAIGPEGGWSDVERSAAPLVGLPGRILRAQTAVIAGGVALAALRESMLGAK